MIKGINKRVIVIKNPNSEMFEEAYFILKNSKGFFNAPKENDMVSEANKLLSEYHAQQRNGAGKKGVSRGFAADGEETPAAVALCGVPEQTGQEGVCPSADNSRDKLRSMIRVLSSRSIKSRNIRLIIGGFLFGVSSMSAVIIIVRLAQYFLGR